MLKLVKILGLLLMASCSLNNKGGSSNMAELSYTDGGYVGGQRTLNVTAVNENANYTPQIFYRIYDDRLETSFKAANGSSKFLVYFYETRDDSLKINWVKFMGLRQDVYIQNFSGKTTNVSSEGQVHSLPSPGVLTVSRNGLIFDVPVIKKVVLYPVGTGVVRRMVKVK